MDAPGRLSLRWVSSAEEIPPALWAQCFAPPLEGAWWYRVLEQSALADQFTFAYALLERDTIPVGIVPTFLMDVPIDLVAPPPIARFLRWAGGVLPRLRYQRTLFVGSPCSDEGTVGLLPGVPLAEVIRLMQDALNQRAKAFRASMIVWKDFPQEEGTRTLVQQERGLFRVVSYPGTRLSLPVGGWGAYLQTLSAPCRYRLRKKLRRSHALGDLHATVVQNPRDAVLEEIFGLFWQTYEKGKTKFERGAHGAKRSATSPA